jgi:probable phosphoglycerate mutase
MPRLLLVRHGESEWNAAGRWQGQADPPLTDTGRSQAMRAARAIGAVDAIVASDLQRARDTAEILAAAIGIGPVVVDPRLRERHAGEWSGLTRADIHAEWPGYLADDPLHREAAEDDETTAGAGESAPPGERRPPGWEPDEQLLERVLAALAELTTALPSGDALVVTHGGVIYAIEHALGATHERVPNLGARWLEVDGSRLTLGERIALLDLGEPTGARVDRDAI